MDDFRLASRTSSFWGTRHSYSQALETEAARTTAYRVSDAGISLPRALG